MDWSLYDGTSVMKDLIKYLIAVPNRSISFDYVNRYDNEHGLVLQTFEYYKDKALCYYTFLV